jgi:hypothetical protein
MTAVTAMLPPFLFNAKFVLSEYQLALTAAGI